MGKGNHFLVNSVQTLCQEPNKDNQLCFPEDPRHTNGSYKLRAFVRRVHLILTVQLAVTAGIICMLFIYWRRLKERVLMNSWFSYPLLST
ncbi:hypothetical protein Y1Q_0003562 [Alligator mississippiensis]|uniref:Uncharacterized protein n=1 Tax=Alligator mississippiensis TaxID=8496 RepID=A0A151M4H4_ALLMI|nr:hypothetical protein Y1Q_0003562 [Alligator mississippiensis]